MNVCQHYDLLGQHSMYARARRQLRRALGIRRVLRGRRDPGPRLGEPSRFAPGSWVRVKDEGAIRGVLGDHERTRGLQFLPAQFLACGGIYEVDRQVRRLRDDHGRCRAVSRTVLLEGVSCAIGGPELGCGRHCPLMFRDEWLEPAEPPVAATTAPSARSYARVRDAAEIAAGLDLRGRRDGLSFMPEMSAYAGRRLPVVGTLARIFELDRSVATRAPIYLLGGAQCSGAICGSEGPCDRACTLMWHADWLIFE